jgi:hypothetical protein
MDHDDPIQKMSICRLSRGIILFYTLRHHSIKYPNSDGVMQDCFYQIQIQARVRCRSLSRTIEI